MVPEPSKKKKKQKLLKPPLNSEIKYWKGYPYRIDQNRWWTWVHDDQGVLKRPRPVNLPTRMRANLLTPPLAKSLLERNSTWITSLRLEDWDQDPRPKLIPFPKIKQQLRNGQAVEGNATELWTCKEMDELSLLWKSLTTPPHWPLYDSERMAIYFWYFFCGRFWNYFWVPGSMLSCFSAFLLLCFSASLLVCFSACLLLCFTCFFSFLLLCFPCFSAVLLLCFTCFFSFLLLRFSAFVLLCLSTSTILLTVFFSSVMCFCCSTSCSSASLLPVFAASLFFLLRYSLLFVNTLGETQRNLKEF